MKNKLFPYICKRCGDETGNKDGDGLCYHCHNIVRLNMGGITQVDVYGHEFGLIIPCESGYLWEQQTDGVMCHHIDIEGVYIPLDYPHEWDEKSKKRINLLERLTEANYDGKPTGKIWSAINKELPFTYTEVDPPKRKINPYPPAQEGLKWITLTDFDKGYGGSIWRQFKGKTIAFIYPNCD